MIEPSGSTTNSWQGRVVGNYRVLRPLGEGAMGCVFEGRHIFLERRVAIKFIRNEAMTSPRISERFFREAQSLNALQSEHIVQVVDFGKVGASPYLVMEFAEGQNLRDVMSEGALPPATALDIAIQVCEGLSVSHAKGIIHRDIKPENLVLSVRDDGRRLVRILDFGIATRDASRSSSTTTFATESGIAIGSPLYMAPEQVQDASQVGAQADIYALGVILFEMLSGKRPFDGGREEIFAAKLFSEPPHLSALGVRFPELLTQCISKAMARALDTRFATIEELKLALTDCVRALDAPPVDSMRGRASAVSPVTLNYKFRIGQTSGDCTSTLPSAEDAAVAAPAGYRLQRTEEFGTALGRASFGTESHRTSSSEQRWSSTFLFVGTAVTVALAGAWWIQINEQWSDKLTHARAHASVRPCPDEHPAPVVHSEPLPEHPKAKAPAAAH